MRRIILSSFIIILSLSLVSCNNAESNLKQKESTESKSSKSIRKDLKTYFMTTNEESNTVSNWVLGEANENPLEEKEEVTKNENIITVDSNENNPTVGQTQNTNNNATNNTGNTNNNFVPDPNYDMNDIVPGPDDTGFNPIDYSANPDYIVADPYANGDEESEDEQGYKIAEDRYFGGEPQ